MIIHLGEHYYDYVVVQLYNSSNSLVYTSECEKTGAYYSHTIPVQPQGYYSLIVRNSDDLVLGVEDVYSDGFINYSESDLYNLVYFQLFWSLPLIKTSKPKVFVLNTGIEKGVTEHEDGASGLNQSYCNLTIKWDNVTLDQRTLIFDFYRRVDFFDYTPTNDNTYRVQPLTVNERQALGKFSVEMNGAAIRGV